MAKTKTLTKRAPQDATLRNVRAAKTRDASLGLQITKVLALVGDLQTRVDALEVHAQESDPDFTPADPGADG